MLKRTLLPIIALGFVLSAALALSLSAAGLSIGQLALHRISTDSSGAQSNGGSTSAAISANGQFVAFVSEASNLVAGDNNGWRDAFVHNLATGETTLLSQTTNGAPGGSWTYWDPPALSADGRYIAFTTLAQLDSRDTNGQYDIYVRDQQNQTTRVVSVDSGGDVKNSSSQGPAISADGRFVVFSSRGGFDPNFPVGTWEVYLHDRDIDGNGVFDETGGIETRVVSLRHDGSGTGSAGSSFGETIDVSDDGRFIVFESGSNNLVPNDTNGQLDVFVHDRDVDGDGIFDEPGQVTTVRISDAANGSGGNNRSGSPRLSGSGRYVVFESQADNLVADDSVTCGGVSSSCTDIFRHDRDVDNDGVFDEPGQTATILVSRAADGSPGNQHSYAPDLTPDGQTVAFYSLASNLDGAINSTEIFRKDLASGVVQRVTAPAGGGTANGSSTFPAVAADGQRVAFASFASNLVANDTNFAEDIFVLADLGGPTPTPTATHTPTPTPSPTPSQPSPLLTEPTPYVEDSPQWIIQELGLSGPMDIAVQGNGYPAVATIRRAPGSLLDTVLIYFWDGVRWVGKEVGSSSNLADQSASKSLSFKIDDSDRTHLTYWDAEIEGLVYVHETGSEEWEREVVWNGSAPESKVDLLLVGHEPHIVLDRRVGNQNQLLHLAFDGANWVQTAVASSTVVGDWWAAATGGDVIGVAYITESTVHYAAKAQAGGWQTQPTGIEVSFAGIALILDGAGEAALFYQNNKDLSVAQESASWSTTLVGSAYESIDHIDAERSADGIVAFYAEEDGFGREGLFIAQQSGASWEIDLAYEEAEESDFFGLELAVDRSNTPHVVFNGRPDRESLITKQYLSRLPEWSTLTVDSGSGNPAVDLFQRRPFIAYSREENEALAQRAAWWDDGRWISSTVASETAAGSAIVAGEFPETLSFDETTSTLYHAAWNGSGWNQTPVAVLDNFESISADVALLEWSATTYAVYLVYGPGKTELFIARESSSGWELASVTLAVPAGVAIDYSAAVAGEDQIFVSYHNPQGGSLHVVSWNGAAFVDELVDDGQGRDVGTLNQLAAHQTYSDSGPIFELYVTYLDTTENEIRYAKRAESWHIESLVAPNGPITDLSLHVAGDFRPRIGYVNDSQKAIYYLEQIGSITSWEIEAAFVGETNAPASVDVVHDVRSRLVVRSGADEIIYMFENAPPLTAFPFRSDVPEQTVFGPGNWTLGGLVAGCLIPFFELLNPEPDLQPDLNVSLQPSDLSDEQVWAAVTELFNNSAAGRRYNHLMLEHGAEIVQILVEDPALAWDGYVVLNGFMPGLRGLVTGNGDAYELSSEQLQAASDVWQRLAAAGSPELANVIDGELSRTNNLQNFVGMSYLDWSDEIGVTSHPVFLPLIVGTVN